LRVRVGAVSASLCRRAAGHIGLGTGNYCIMFASEDIELLGIVDSTDFVQGLDAFLARQPGRDPVLFAGRRGFRG
jgi:hypothetical protein